MTAILYNIIAIVLVISGCIAPPVLGSIWEENLNLPLHCKNIHLDKNTKTKYHINESL
jgi:hypothetical protein